MLGQVSTRNNAMRETLDLVVAEFKRMAAHGPTDDEVATAKNQLVGGLLLGIDGNAALADTLVGFALDGHGEDEWSGGVPHFCACQQATLLVSRRACSIRRAC